MTHDSKIHRLLPISPRNGALLCIFIFLLARLLIGCDRDKAISPGTLHIGDAAPDFAAKDLAGNVVILSSQPGPVILRFFETNCRFCKADTPGFIEFFKKHNEKGLRIFYIGSFYENAEALKAFAEGLGATFPIITDQGAKLADLYGIRAYPQTVFISSDKKIIAALLGGVGERELAEIMEKYVSSQK